MTMAVPAPGVEVSVKRNPGSRTHRECGTGGYIGLQNHGNADTVSFRNIQVKELEVQEPFVNELTADPVRGGAPLFDPREPVAAILVNSSARPWRRKAEFTKVHDFADWTARSRTSAEDIAALQRMLLGAPESTRQTFAVVTDPDDPGTLVSFTDRKTLFVVTKPGR